MLCYFWEKIVLVPNIWIYAKWNLISSTPTIFGFPWQSYFAEIQKWTLPSSFCFGAALSRLMVIFILWDNLSLPECNSSLQRKYAAHIMLSRNYDQPPHQMRERKMHLPNTQIYLDMLELFSKSTKANLRLFCVRGGGSWWWVAGKPLGIPRVEGQTNLSA